MPTANHFDHSYRSYAALLTSIVRGARVDYRLLVSRKDDLDRAVSEFGDAGTDERWDKNQRMAFWINAYNVFTLKAIADRYPIRGKLFSLNPRNSIRQIDGVWTDLKFHAASRTLTLDDIEHRILRPEFKDPRIHFAINCASISCPPLREEPYLAARLDAQLDDAARRYLASPLGLQVDGDTLRVSSILKWYGDDFLPAFGSVPAVIAKYGPREAQRIAQSPGVRIRFLRYDWSLNDSSR